jgi:fibronectin-binding autotransporter adhesin
LTSAATDVDQNFTVGTLTLSNAGDSATILNGVALTVEGNISNAGTITLGSTGGTTELQVGTSAGGANVILSGGTLVMSNNAPNYIFGVTGTDTLTNEETISGSGNIGNGQLTLVNSATGVINANGSAGMTIDANGGLTNTGTIEATGGSTLNLLNMGPQVGTTGITNTGGTILANASTLVVTSSTITGGTITLTGASTLELNNKRDHGRHADQRAHLSKH